MTEQNISRFWKNKLFCQSTAVTDIDWLHGVWTARDVRRRVNLMVKGIVNSPIKI